MAPTGNETTGSTGLTFNLRQSEMQRYNGKYSGMGPETCDQEARKLIQEAHQNHDWQHLPEQLLALRNTRERQGTGSESERRTGT